MPNTVRGQVSVTVANDRLIGIVAGTTAAPIMPPGGTAGPITNPVGTGDYIDSIILMAVTPNTVGSNAVYLADNGSGTVQIYGTLIAGSLNTASDSATKQIFLGVTSRNGRWRLSTQAGQFATVIGKFNP